MNIIKKITISALLSLSVFGLTASLPALADGASDAALYCTGCHNGLTVNGPMVFTPIVVGGGSMACLQRSVADWVSTINRMNGKGCGVPSHLINGIASYLNNGWFQMLCYYPNGTSFPNSGDLPCPPGTSNTPPPTCSNGLPTYVGGSGYQWWQGTWVCPSTTTSSTTSTSSSTTSSTTTTTVFKCSPYYFSDSPSSLSFTATQGGGLPTSQSLSISFYNYLQIPQWSVISAPAWLSVTPMNGSGSAGLTVSIPSTQLAPGVYTGFIDFSSSTLGCHIYIKNSVPVSFTVEPTVTTSTSTTTTVATTTTTTLCNPYVNGTTQHKYSGSGSCHSFALDLVTGAHIVREQKYCRQHMTHFNSSGNHVHAYPHPACM